jgi:hypothetical protein
MIGKDCYDTPNGRSMCDYGELFGSLPRSCQIAGIGQKPSWYFLPESLIAFAPL